MGLSVYERQQARGLSAQEVPVDVKTKICTLPDSTPFSRHLLALIRRFHCGSDHAESRERCISAQDADSIRKKKERKGRTWPYRTHVKASRCASMGQLK